MPCEADHLYVERRRFAELLAAEQRVDVLQEALTTIADMVDDPAGVSGGHGLWCNALYADRGPCNCWAAEIARVLEPTAVGSERGTGT